MLFNYLLIIKTYSILWGLKYFLLIRVRFVQDEDKRMIYSPKQERK